MGYADDRFETVCKNMMPPPKIETIWFSKACNVPKGWGKEVQIANNIVLPGEAFPTGYSGKLLVYNKLGAKSSMHFHTKKHETFYVLKGSFTVWYYDPDTADLKHEVIGEGDKVVIPPYNPHQVTCKCDDGIIIEFASSDYSWDNFRIGKGDSQTLPKPMCCEE